MKCPQILQHASKEFTRMRGTAVKPLTVVKIVLLLGFISYMSYAVVRPIVKGNEKKAETVKLAQLVKKTQGEKNHLLQRKDYLSSPQGINNLAHEKGMVGPGEESVHYLVPKQDQQPKPAHAAATNKMTLIGEAVLAGLFLLTLLLIVGAGLLLYRWRMLRSRRPVGMLTPRSELRRRRRHAAHEA